MNEQLEVQILLKEVMVVAKQKNQNYSLRSLARKISITPTAVSEIIRGKRRVSKAMAEKILNALLIDPARKTYILSLFKTKLKNDSKYSKLNQNAFIQRQITHEQFEVFSDWVHFAILSMIKTTDFQSDINWIADRLGVSTHKVESALQNLLSQSMIEKDNNGHYRRTTYSITAPEDVLNLSVQKSHLNDLDIIKEKMSVNVMLRDFTSFTLPVDTKLLPVAKNIIRRAQDEINNLMEQGDRTQVYRHCSYLFPLTKN